MPEFTPDNTIIIKSAELRDLLNDALEHEGLMVSRFHLFTQLVVPVRLRADATEEQLERIMLALTDDPDKNAVDAPEGFEPRPAVDLNGIEGEGDDG